MKRNILYLAGFALLANALLVSCSEDEPNYSNLEVDTQTITIDLDETEEGSCNIVEGNGNYRVTSSDESVATVALSGNKIIVTGLQYGSATITVSDWAKKSTNIKVVVDKEQVLAMTKGSATLFFDGTATDQVYTGNGEYAVTSANESVATATIDENGKVEIKGVAAGKTTLTVTDRRGKTAEVAVKVIRHLVVEDVDLTYMLMNEDVVINITDGNGGYTCSTTASASTKLTCRMSEDGKAVIVNSAKRQRIGSDNKTYYVTIKDQEGQSRDFVLGYVEQDYLSSPTFRYLVAGTAKSQTINTWKVGMVNYSDMFNMSEIAIKSAAMGNFISGFSVRFLGDLTVGEKTNPVLYRIYKGALVADSPIEITDCRIDKVENGWYWVSFQEAGQPRRSYIITKQS